jgi:site-specific recombinase XerD
VPTCFEAPLDAASLLPSATAIQIARTVLAQLGVTADDLAWKPVPVPTFADYLPRVIAAAGPGAQRTYGPYWDRIHNAWADRRLHEPTASDIATLAEQAKASRVLRRNARSGHSTAEHLLRAMRAIYTQAVADEIIPAQHNPAAKVPLPRRPTNYRRGLARAELAEINQTAATTGNDVALDTLLIRHHLETACRRGAALRMRADDLDPHWCLVRLREKNNVIRWQPASPTLIAALVAHRDKRGTGKPTEQLLRYRDGRPITSRRYDHLWHRLGTHLPWIAAQNISTHWLRHTTLTWVERHYGYGIAAAYAGHAPTHHDHVTTTYLHADLPDLATALAAYTGEPHPLAE